MPPFGHDMVRQMVAQLRAIAGQDHVDIKRGDVQPRIHIPLFGHVQDASKPRRAAQWASDVAKLAPSVDIDFAFEASPTAGHFYLLIATTDIGQARALVEDVCTHVLQLLRDAAAAQDRINHARALWEEQRAAIAAAGLDAHWREDIADSAAVAAASVAGFALAGAPEVLVNLRLSALPGTFMRIDRALRAAPTALGIGLLAVSWRLFTEAQAARIEQDERRAAEAERRAAEEDARRRLEAIAQSKRDAAVQKERDDSRRVAMEKVATVRRIGARALEDELLSSISSAAPGEPDLALAFFSALLGCWSYRHYSSTCGRRARSS